MRFISIMKNDLHQIIRDRQAALYLILMPVLFTLIFGFIFQGNNGKTEKAFAIGVVLPAGDTMAEAIYAQLENVSGYEPFRITDSFSMDALKASVKKQKMKCALIIPEGFSASLRNGEKPGITLIIDKKSVSGIAVEQSIFAIIQNVTDAAKTALFNVKSREQLSPFADEAARNEYFNAVFRKALTEWENPPIQVTLERGDTKNIESSSSSGNSFAHSSVGMLMQFAIAGLIGAATIFVTEREQGVLRRLMSTAVTKPQIMFGHFSAMYLMILVQFAILIAFGQIVFGVPYFSSPLATVLISLASVFFIASLGLLIGVLAKSQEQVTVYGLVPMFVLSALGGAWVPLEYTGKVFQTIGHLTPLAWAIDGFENVTIRLQGVSSVLLPAAIVFLYGAACFAIGAWRFHRLEV